MTERETRHWELFTEDERAHTFTTGDDPPLSTIAPETCPACGDEYVAILTDARDGIVPGAVIGDYCRLIGSWYVSYVIHEGESDE